MIYVKAFLIGLAMFLLAFALALALMMRHAFVPLTVVPTNAEVSFDFNSDWVVGWQPLLAGMAAFAGAFFWTLRRSLRS